MPTPGTQARARSAEQPAQPSPSDSAASRAPGGSRAALRLVPLAKEREPGGWRIRVLEGALLLAFAEFVLAGFVWPHLFAALFLGAALGAVRKLLPGPLPSAAATACAWLALQLGWPAGGEHQLFALLFGTPFLAAAGACLGLAPPAPAVRSEGAAAERRTQSS